jgi:hypothetical protein
MMLLTVVVFALASLSPAFAQDYTPVFEPGECPIPDLPGVSCGTLIVPEDRSDPAGAQVELAVAIIAA